MKRTTVALLVLSALAGMAVAAWGLVCWALVRLVHHFT